MWTGCKNVGRYFAKAEKSKRKVSTPRKSRCVGRKNLLVHFEKYVMHIKFLDYSELWKEIPALRDLFFVKNETGFQGRKYTFMNSAKGMGFSFKNYKHKRCLWIQREDFVAHHAAYLIRYEKEAKKPVVCTDETWAYTCHTVEKFWQHNTVPV
jgi:hypothetical protein